MVFVEMQSSIAGRRIYYVGRDLEAVENDASLLKVGNETFQSVEISQELAQKLPYNAYERGTSAILKGRASFILYVVGPIDTREAA
jgi:hypothetical protein